MKIKCPFCSLSNFDKYQNGLREHMFEHHHDDVSNRYSDLIIKIHERIEHYENSDGDANEITSYECDMNILEELKSLLENKSDDDCGTFEAMKKENKVVLDDSDWKNNRKENK